MSVVAHEIDRRGGADKIVVFEFSDASLNEKSLAEIAKTCKEDPIDTAVWIQLFAVRSMTSLPAQIPGLKDRGMLRENYWADVAVFDPEKVRDRATYADPHQYAEGAPYVMVNGELVVDGGKITGKLPGKVLTSSDRRQNMKNQP
ncbi:MAG TPA: amidohydrolase family protein [Blastocatellia bacterium]|nr:amidohydrolase family protein [Blastocatellia bacterium]